MARVVQPLDNPFVGPLQADKSALRQAQGVSSLSRDGKSRIPQRASNYVFPMRLYPLLFAAIVMTTGVSAQEPQVSPAPPESSSASPVVTKTPSPAQDGAQLNLPVSLDHIRKALEQQPAPLLLKLPDNPTFRTEIH